MTDSASWRRNRRGGRHQQPVRRDSSRPLPPDVARQNREQAFGTSPRTWVDAPADRGADPVDPAAPSTPVDQAAQGGRTAASAPADPTVHADRTAHADRGEHGDRPAASSRPVAPAASAEPPTEPLRPAADPVAPSGSPTSAAAPVADPSGSAVPPVRRTGHGRRAARPIAAEHDLAAAASSPEPAEEHDAWSTAGRPAAAAERGAVPSREPSRPADVTAAAPAAAAGPAEAPSSGSGPGSGSGAGSGSGSGSGSGDEPPSDRGPRDERPEPSRRGGSLGRVAAWTVGTTVLPGLGLVTTRMRKLGWVLLGVLAAVVLGVAAFLLLGDPLRTGVKLVTHRGVLIALLVAAAVAMIVWMVQIVLAALAHSTAQRLERRRRLVALGLAAVMVIAVGLPFGRGVQSLWATQGLLGSDSVFSRSGSSTLADGEDPWAGVGRINILMLGQDAGQDRTGTRPDTIMVASVDTATGKTALFSIPRNLEKVHFPEGTVAAEKFPDGFDYYGKNQNLINAVWAWAEENKDLFPGDDSPGLTATTWAVEETLGLKTDYYAQVNLQGFEDMVNAIGGVDMVVERRIPIGGGTNQATGGKYPITGYIEPGQQHLDGYHALWYARSREGSDDFNRMCRQQRMVRVVTEESNPATLAMSIPGLVTATENNIVTDIPTSDIDAFAELALRIKDSGFKSYPITQDVTPSYDADWDYLKKWTQASIEDSMQSTGAQSVTGETKAGSTEPAETGAAPDQESSSSAEEEETTTEEATPTEEESSSTGDETSSESSAPVIEQDPLKSCLPGAEEGN